MPKTDRGHRNSLRNSGHYYNLSPVTAGQPYNDLGQPRLTADYYSVQQPIQNMPTSYTTSAQQNNYTTGGPVQPIHQTYVPLPSHTPVAPPITSLRPSSGAWSPTDDQTLMTARASGMNWAPIQQTYFHTKTPNACRKRHERLMERRSADDWDGLKLEGLAKNYMGMRREIWTPLAEATGEKWTVVEQKCMSQGLKNLQTASRSHARRERLLSPSASHSHHNSLSHSPNHGFPPYSSSTSSGAYVRDDSGIEIEDLEGADYNDGSSERMSSSSSAYGGQHYGHGHSGSGGSGVGGYHTHAGRLPSIDMGIDAIINRPRQ